MIVMSWSKMVVRKGTGAAASSSTYLFGSSGGQRWIKAAAHERCPISDHVTGDVIDN